METGISEYYVLTKQTKATIITRYKKKVEKKRSTFITLKEKIVHWLKDD